MDAYDRIDRMKEELYELDEKQSKLHSFILEHSEKDITRRRLSLMRLQDEVMIQYKTILEMRIEAEYEYLDLFAPCGL